MRAIVPIEATIVTALLSLTAQLASANQNETPDAFVRRVYANYKTSDNSTGVDMTRPAGSAFYAASLLDASAKDRALLQEKEGVIDADPLCDCQAWENLRVKTIALTKAEAGAVKARVLLENFVGTQRVVTAVVLTLSKTPAGWRIADIGDRHRASVMTALQNEIHELEKAARPGTISEEPKP